MSATTAEEIRQRLKPINDLLDDAHPGLVTWKLALVRSIAEFCKWWLGVDSTEARP